LWARNYAGQIWILATDIRSFSSVGPALTAALFFFALPLRPLALLLTFCE
jgi:hypothetical protein